MREEIRDAVQIVYRDGPIIRRIRGIQLIDTDPVFVKLIRADGTIFQINRALVDRIEEGPV